MHRCAILISKIFRGHSTHTPVPGTALRRLLPRPHTLGALRAYRDSLGPSAPLSSPIRNPESTPGRTHPLKILATPMLTASFRTVTEDTDKVLLDNCVYELGGIMYDDLRYTTTVQMTM